MTTTFLTQYMAATEVAKCLNPDKGPAFGGPVIFDYPLKSFSQFAVVAGLRLNRARLNVPSMIVANEAGAIFGALMAAGYKPIEIIGFCQDGTLDVVSLIEDGQKMPDALHIRKKGADHKGFRFRDQIDSLICQKLGLPNGKKDPYATLQQLRAAGLKIPLYITALDLTSAGIVTLSADNFPGMAVADAVLASCAVQPYIGALKWDMDDDTTHQIMCCSQKQSLPLEVARTIFTQGNYKGRFGSEILAYGCNSTENEAGTASSKGSGLQQYLLTERAAAVVPADCKNRVLLF